MSFESVRAGIAKLVKDGWTGPAALEIEWPNQPFKAPEGKAWARYAPLFGERDAADVGASRVRQPGVITIQVFCPEDKGTADAYKAGDLLKTILERKQVVLSPALVATFAITTVEEAGERDGYKQFTVAVPFYVDETT